MDHVHVLEWLNLFDSQLFQLLIHNRHQWHIFEDLLPPGRLLELNEDHVRQLLDEIRATEYRPLLLFKVCEFVKQTDPNLVAFISHHNLSASHLSKFLFAISKLSPYLCANTIYGHFSAYSLHAFSALYPIWKQWKVIKSIDEVTALQILLQNLPFLSANAAEHLVYAVWKYGNAEARRVIYQNWPNFEQMYEHVRSMESRPKRLTITSGVSIEHAFNVLDTSQHDPFAGIELPKVYKSFMNDDQSKEVPIKLRNYQKELTTKAVNGENVLICAPTNSGKTIVAAYIIQEHYKRSLQFKTNFKVVFLVPTRFLVGQQTDVINKYFDRRLKIERLTGNGGEARLAPKILDADIVVMTPEVLRSNLNKPLCELNRVPIDLFSMIIFDECHACKDNTPFNKILQIYHDTKTISAARMPQIIGLTASIGVGKPKNNAVLHAAKMCANLDASHIVRVREHLEELYQHVPTIPDTIETCDSSSNDFVRKLEELKQDFEHKLLALFSNPRYKSLFEEVKCALKIQNLYDYRSTLGQILNGLAKERDIDLPVRQRANTLLQHLITINDCVQSARYFDKASCIKVLRTHLNRFARNKSTELDQLKAALTLLESLDDFVAPILTRLIQILTADLNEGPKMRCLAFIKTREFCVELAQIIERYMPTKKADYLTGSAEYCGLNDNEQQAKLNAFREGQIHVLCATSIADEGLDIADCNLIVKFDYSTNCVAHVQRRGRGRAEGTRSLLLSENALTTQQEQENIEKEKLMNEALELIDQNIPAFQQQIKDQLLVNKKERDREQLEQVKLEGELSNSIYVMACRNCDKFLCRSTDIYTLHGTKYVVADPLIWNRIRTRYVENSEEYDMNAPMIGKIYCNNLLTSGRCNKMLGSVVFCIDGAVLLPIFKCINVVFVDAGNNVGVSQTPSNGEKRFPLKNWKMVTTERLFKPKPLGYWEKEAMIQNQPYYQFSEQNIERFANINLHD